MHLNLLNSFFYFIFTGGFIPKGPGIIDEYYAVYPSTPPGPPVPHLTTSMQLDIAKGMIQGFVVKLVTLQQTFLLHDLLKCINVPRTDLSLDLSWIFFGSFIDLSQPTYFSGECVTGDGRHIPEGDSMSLACSVCTCAWGELHCSPRPCQTPSGCRRRPATNNAGDLCCGELICDKGK